MHTAIDTLECAKTINVTLCLEDGIKKYIFCIQCCIAVVVDGAVVFVTNSKQTWLTLNTLNTQNSTSYSEAVTL